MAIRPNAQYGEVSQSAAEATGVEIKETGNIVYGLRGYVKFYAERPGYAVYPLRDLEDVEIVTPSPRPAHIPRDSSQRFRS